LGEVGDIETEITFGLKTTKEKTDKRRKFPGERESSRALFFVNFGGPERLRHPGKKTTFGKGFVKLEIQSGTKQIKLGVSPCGMRKGSKSLGRKGK